MVIHRMNEIGCEGKTILLRLDLNSPIDPASGEILDDKRFREHLPTIQALSDSKVIIVTHQSRPGKKDFTTLETHAEKLQQMLKHEVRYIDDIFGSNARDSVKSLKRGDILMLENVRFNAEENLTLKPEDAKKTHLVKNLAKIGDLFVNDAFGTAHRSQPSVVGLPMVMKSASGLLMGREVEILSKVLEDAPRPVTFVLGGTKVDDSMDVARNVLEKGIADQVMTIGVVANVFLMAQGISIGTPSTQLVQQLGYNPEVERARELIRLYGDRIRIPRHVAIKKDNRREECPVEAIPDSCPVLDLGLDSITDFCDHLHRARTVVFNGPAGVFEEKDFATGTYELLRATSKTEFSVIGGGHTAAVVEKMGIDKEITHISTGGGACIEFLTGKKLPAVQALEQSALLFP